MKITRRTFGAAAAAAATPAAAAGPGFTPRLKVPRMAPIPPEARSAAQKAMMAKRSEYNIYKTLAAHPELYERWSGLGQFVLNGSSLPARHREMLILRMGWLCQAEYEWAQHARIATGAVGMDPPDVHRIAVGPTAKGWTAFERALLTACDEIRYEEMISDATWAALKTQYSDQTAMDAVFTAAQYQLVSMALNSLGVQLDPDLTYRLPRDVPPPPLAGFPRAKALAAPRIAPKPVAALTADDKELLAERYLANGTVMNLYATLITHPKLYGPRAKFGSFIQRDSGLPPRTRELCILRTAVNVACDYEWEHHLALAKTAGLSGAEIERVRAGPDARGWSAVDAATLRAADELRREAFISDRTWATLKGHFAPQRLLEIIFTIGGYAMTGAAIRSFGIQLEPEYRKG
jgi:4-carboxymuconolactone decarboxylase